MKQTSKKWLGTLLSLCLIGALLLGTLPMSLVGATNSTNLITDSGFEAQTVGTALPKASGDATATTNATGTPGKWFRYSSNNFTSTIQQESDGNKYLAFQHKIWYGLGDKLEQNKNYKITFKIKPVDSSTKYDKALYVRLDVGSSRNKSYSVFPNEDLTGDSFIGSKNMKALPSDSWTEFTFYYQHTAANATASADSLSFAYGSTSDCPAVHIDDVTFTEMTNTPTTEFDGGLVYDGGFELQQNSLAKANSIKNPSTDRTNWYLKESASTTATIKTEGTNTYLEFGDRVAIGLNNAGLVKGQLYQISFKVRAVSNSALKAGRLDPRMVKGSSTASFGTYSATSKTSDLTGAAYLGGKDFGTITADAWSEYVFYYQYTEGDIAKGIDSIVFIASKSGTTYPGNYVQLDDVCVKPVYVDTFDGKMVTDGGFNNQSATLAAVSATDYPKTDSATWYTKTKNNGLIKTEVNGNNYLELTDRAAVGLNTALVVGKTYAISFKLRCIDATSALTRLDPRIVKGSALGTYAATSKMADMSGAEFLNGEDCKQITTTAWSNFVFYYTHTEENAAKNLDSLLFVVGASGKKVQIDEVLVQEFVPDVFDGIMINDGGFAKQKASLDARSASGKNPSNDDDNWYVKTAGKATVKADSSLNNYLEFTDRVFVGLNQALVKDQYYKISFKLKAVDATTALKALYIRMYNGANDNYANTYNVATGYASNDNVIGATEMKQRVTNTGWTEFTFYYQHGDEGVNEALDSLGFIYGDTTNPILLDEVLVKPYNVQTFNGGLIKDGGFNAQSPVLAAASATANSETDDDNWYVATANAASVKYEADDNNYLEFTDRVFVGINGDLKKDQLYKINFRLKAPTGGAESLQALYIRMYDGAGRSKYGDCSNSFNMNGGAYIGAAAMKSTVTDSAWVDVTYYYLHTQANIDKGVDSLGFVYGSKTTTVLLDAVSVTEFTLPDYGDAMIIDSEFDQQNATLDMATALNSPANDPAHWYSSGENLAVVKTEKDGNNYLEMTGNAYIGLNQPLELNGMYKLTFRVKKANANMFNEPFRPRLYDAGLSKNAGLVDRIDLTGNQYIGSYALRSNLSEEEWLEYTYYYQHSAENAEKNLSVLRFDVWEYNTPDAPEVICLDSVVFTKMNYGVVGDKATASYTGALFNEMNLQKLIDKKSDLSASKVYKINAKPFNMYTIGITAGSSKVSNSKIYLSFDGTNVMALSEANAPTPVIKADGTRSRRYSYEILTDETGVIYLIVENDDKALQIEDITVFQSLSRSTQLPIGVANDPNVSLYAADTLKELRVVGAEDADTATDASPETGEAPVLPVLLIVFALALSTAVLVMLKKGGAQA